MKILPIASLLPLAFILGAISIGTSAADGIYNADTSVSSDSHHETILLVSLEDGSVIKQTIRSSADLCFKKNSDSATTCLTQGEPVIDPVTNAVIGFEMVENQIELIARTD